MNRNDINRRAEYFNRYTSEDKEMACNYMMEEMVENAKKLDMFMNGTNGKFDPENEKHVRIFAKCDIINDLLSSIVDDIQ